MRVIPAQVEEGELSDWLKFLKAESEEEFKMLAIRNPVMSLPATSTGYHS